VLYKSTLLTYLLSFFSSLSSNSGCYFNWIIMCLLWAIKYSLSFSIDQFAMCKGLARSCGRDAFASEKHRRSAERNIVATDSVAWRHSSDDGENHVSRELPQQPSGPAAFQLPDDAGLSRWSEGTVSTGQRRCDWTHAVSYWGRNDSTSVLVLSWWIHYTVCVLMCMVRIWKDERLML